MCGIAGWIGTVGTAVEDPLGRALEALAPRGPDGVGRTAGQLGERPVRLGVTRLELTDPGGASQPVERPSGSLLVLNGEIYNHRALRRELEAEGERFATNGDAEVLAVLLERRGVDGLADVEGSYAFAFLRGPDGPLWLGRDPLGVRPLVCAVLPDSVLFGSTLEAVTAPGAFEVEPDLDALAEYLRDGVVSTGRTALMRVRRVAPGEVVCFDHRLRLTRERVPTRLSDGADEPADVLGALRHAVGARLQGPRPAAVFLSGGVDSAVIAALGREHGLGLAYTLTYPDHAGADEAHRARRSARRLGLVHEEVSCPRDPTPWVLQTARAFDEPFGDASAVPTWGLALAAGRKVPIVLTGTGGDEVFGGYRRYWLLGSGPWLRHVPAFLRQPLSSLLERSLPAGARMLRAASDPQGFYRGLLRLQPLGEGKALVGPLLEDADDPVAGRGPGNAAEAMADDFRCYLPDDLLVKEDRALMAHGVEGRHPFLDRRVRLAAHRVDVTGGVGRGQQKRLLRAFVAEVVDPDLARAPKHGFAFPVDELYRGPLSALAQDVIRSQSLRERGFISPVGASRALREHLRGGRDLGAVIHAIVMLELWALRVLDGKGADAIRTPR
jgi:asparagine synthase (glutamine-hydrolysing)